MKKAYQDTEMSEANNLNLGRTIKKEYLADEKSPP